MIGKRLGLVFLLFLAAVSSFAQGDVPALQGRVTDQANLIAPDQKQRIEAQLAQFEQQTGNQVAVLTVETLDGEDIEGYANRVASAWALGQKGKDNGALLLVAHSDRKMRIEVGYGLEPVLTDLQTSVIQNEVIIPYFKKGDFGGGIEAGVKAILSTVEGKAIEPAPVQQPSGGGGGGNEKWPGLFIFLFALGPFIVNAIRSRSWVVYVVFLPVFFILGSIVNSPILGLIAAGAWLVLFPILRMILPKHSTSGRFRGGGWWTGGSGMGGGGGWSSGGGGGGFSGGGGSFGGGGSSSSW